MSNLVEIRNLKFAYGERPILADLQMDFPRGKVVAVMGGSGSGKTTILRLIGGLLAAQEGSITIDGTPVNTHDTDGLYKLRRRMGVLFQNGALFTDLSVFDNVAFPLREHTDLPESLIRDMVLMKLQAVGLRNAAYLKPAEVSGGMARRVALARAIVRDPMLILYDEPFVGLDPIALNQVLRLIRTLNDTLGITSVLVAHEFAAVSRIADVIYLIAGGKVAASGSPADLARGDSPWTRQFFGGEADGPVPFQYPARDYAQDLCFPAARA